MLYCGLAGYQIIMKYRAIQGGIGAVEAARCKFGLDFGYSTFKNVLAQSLWAETWYKSHLKIIEFW